MKQCLLFFMLSAPALLSVPLSAWAGGKVYIIQTNSLTCDFCAYDLEQKFIKMKGVNGFDVDIDGLFFIKADGSLNLDEAYVKKCYWKMGLTLRV